MWAECFTMLISEMGHASHCSAGDNVVVDFAFQTEPAAETAAAALLVQVFLDGSHIHISKRYPAPLIWRSNAAPQGKREHVERTAIDHLAY
jgi:hypothetical protein